MSELADAQIVGHGIDIVETRRIQELVERSGEHFEMECFTATERSMSALGAKRIEYLAGRFAAKEAVLKALGTGWSQGISRLEIEIQRLPSGEPSVVLHGECQEIAEELGITKWLLSISHTSSYAAASAIASGTAQSAIASGTGRLEHRFSNQKPNPPAPLRAREGGA
ncbi:MAG: holo-ACP synthase [Coleofasciculus sp. C3-bin4]|nr:holo-ACP synthase [Coleofasciculus sp. C3-bin4]